VFTYLVKLIISKLYNTYQEKLTIFHFKILIVTILYFYELLYYNFISDNESFHEKLYVPICNDINYILY